MITAVMRRLLAGYPIASHASLQTMSLGSGLANAAYAIGTVLAVQFAQHLPQQPVGRNPAVAAMVLFALVPYLALSAALEPLTPIIAKDLECSLSTRHCSSPGRCSRPRRRALACTSRAACSRDCARACC
jgi:hypothetical protein